MNRPRAAVVGPAGHSPNLLNDIKTAATARRLPRLGEANAPSREAVHFVRRTEMAHAARDVLHDEPGERHGRAMRLHRRTDAQLVPHTDDVRGEVGGQERAVEVVEGGVATTVLCKLLELFMRQSSIYHEHTHGAARNPDAVSEREARGTLARAPSTRIALTSQV